MPSYCLQDDCAAYALLDSSYCSACAEAEAKHELVHEKLRRAPRVGLVYDPLMCGHLEVGHPERPERITSIFDRLEEKGLAQRCITVNSREATQAEILSVHSRGWLEKTESYAALAERELQRVARLYNSIYMNEQTMKCALLSAGSTAEIVKQVCENRLDSGVAVVRPPGHHAEAHCAMGFCIFNNVAMAAQMAVREWGMKRVAIIDWDVHHGNGTQNMFIDNKSILYFSVHRYDYGGFYPGSRNGGPQMVGKGDAQGYNINVGWNEGMMGDEHYKLCFQHVVVPILTDFCPELIIISAGFDAARGDPLGGCDITPAGYASLTSMLAPFGKIVMVLEGGYNLESISESFAACTSILLGDKHSVVKASPPEQTEIPRYRKSRLSSCIKSILDTIKYQAPFWPSLVPFSVLLKEYAALAESNSELQKELLNPTQAIVDAVTEAVSKVSLTESQENKEAAPEEKTQVTQQPTPADSALPQEGFAAPAKHYCPHVAENVTLPLPTTFPSQCHACENKKENWVCLSCHLVSCGRHAQGHMASHVEATGHVVVLGFDDLSFWCYECDSYLHHLLMERIFEVYSQMCEVKFGERPPPGLFQGIKTTPGS